MEAETGIVYINAAVRPPAVSGAYEERHLLALRSPSELLRQKPLIRRGRRDQLGVNDFRDALLARLVHSCGNRIWVPRPAAVKECLARSDDKDAVTIGDCRQVALMNDEVALSFGTLGLHVVAPLRAAWDRTTASGAYSHSPWTLVV